MRSTNHEHDFGHSWLLYDQVLWPVTLSLFISVNGRCRPDERELLVIYHPVDEDSMTTANFVHVCVFVCV